MNTSINIELVKARYQRMTDEELVNIATKDAVGLTLDAQKIIIEELEKRNLDNNISEGVIAQNKTITFGEIDAYCNLIRDLDCPSCGTNEIQLNATLISEVVSFIIITHSNKKLKVACPTCLDKANNDALTKSVVFGWWGIPWGIIKTIQAIGHNTKSKKTNWLEEPNTYLRNYALSKIGLLETYKDDRDKLQEIIGE